MNGKVYFFHNGSECKIGKTCPALARRLWQAHVWSPRSLTVVGWIETEFPEQLETQIHLEMAHRRLVKPSGNGEWFDLTIAETKEVIEKHKHGKLTYKTYSNAPGHPAHSVRQIRGRQQDEAGQPGQGLQERGWSIWNPGPQRVQHVVSPKHAIGGEAFLRKAGS